MSLSEVPGWLLLLAYVSVAIEMLVFAVPSEASTLQLMTRDAQPGEGRLAAARKQSSLTKFLRFFVPTALGVLLFLVPLAVVCWPPLWSYTFALIPIADPRLAWSGLAVIGAGRLLTTVAVLQLRKRLRAERHDLQPQGPFRFSRNPILVGMYLFYLGNCIWLPSPILWLGFLPYAWNMHQRVRMEEDFLLAHMGADYATYMQSVPRYIGRPRDGQR